MAIVIPQGWIELRYYPLDVSRGVNPAPHSMVINKLSITAVRKAPPDVTTCHVHADGVDYKIAETYEQVVGKL